MNTQIIILIVIKISTLLQNNFHTKVIINKTFCFVKIIQKSQANK